MPKSIVLFCLLFLSIPTYSQGGCALLEIVRSNNLDRAREHIGRNQAKNLDCFKSGEYLSPLMIAVKNDNLEMVQLLVNAGADVNQSLSNKVAKDHAVSATMRSYFEESIPMSNRLIEAVRQNDSKEVERILKSSMVSVKSLDDKHYSAIAAAAQEGHPEMIALLLEKGSPVDYPFKAYQNNITPLQLASDSGHIECVKILVETGANLEGNLPSGWTPLMRSINSGRTETAKYLIDKGARIDLPVFQGADPTSLAAARNNLELLQYIISRKNISGTKLKGRLSILGGAFMNGNEEMVSYLMEKGFRPVQVPKYKGTNLLLSACRGQNFKLIKMLVEDYKFDVNAKDEYDHHPLSQAVQWNKDGNTEIVAYLLDKGAKLEEPGHARYTAITQAIDKPKILEFLLKKGASPNPISVIQSPLETACALNQLESVKLLVNYGGNIALARKCANSYNKEIKDYYDERIELAQRQVGEVQSGNFESTFQLIRKGMSPDIVLHDNKTALLYAIQLKKVDAVKELIRLGANVNLITYHKRTPLLFACYTGDDHSKMPLAIIEALVDAGADYKSNEPTPPICAAAWRDQFHIVRYFIEKGVDPNTADKDGTTAMHNACFKNNLESVKYLISAGADPKVKNKRNTTPFHKAAYHGDMEMMRFFVEEVGADINALSTNGATTAIKNAVWLDDTVKVNYLLDLGADPYLTLEGQEDAVQRAFTAPHIEHCHKLFIERGFIVKPYINMQRGRSLLSGIVKSKKYDKLELLLKSEYLPDSSVEQTAHAAIVSALDKYDTTAVDILVKYGVSLDVSDYRGSVLAHYLQHGHSKDRVVSYLLRKGADPNFASGNGEKPPLAFAIEQGNYQITKQLLQKGANPNQTDKHGYLPFHRLKLVKPGMMPIKNASGVMESSNSKILKLLRQYGAHLNKKSPQGYTVLMSSCHMADLASIKYLIENIRMKINDSTEYGNRPIIQVLNPSGYTTYSMEMPVPRSLPFQKESFEYLLKKGAQWNFTSRQCSVYKFPGSNRSGTTHNHHFVYYCAMRHPEAFKILLNYINLNMKAEGMTLEEFLIKAKKSDLLALYRKKKGQ